MLFKNNTTMKKLSKLMALTFALNCVTYTATPLANISISGQNYQNNGQNIHVNVPQVQMFGFGKASAATYSKTVGYGYEYDKEKYEATQSVDCKNGSGVGIDDAMWIIDKEHYDEGVQEICQSMNGNDNEDAEPATATSFPEPTTGTSTATGSTSKPKTTYTSSITYSTGNSNQATVNANLMLDSMQKLADTESGAGREYSTEERNLAYVRIYNNLGVTKDNIDAVRANIEKAEAEALENGEEIPQAVKTLKSVIEKYDEVVGEVTGYNNILGDNPVTLEQLAVIRTALKTEQIKSDTACQNKRVEDANATCELSDKGKEYATLLSYLENQQINQTTGSTTTTNATNTGTQNTSTTTTTTVNTSYGNTNGGNSTIFNGSSASGSSVTGTISTSGMSTVNCNGGVYIESANVCCASDKPFYSNGKCYASLNSSSSSSSSEKDDDDDNMSMLMMMAMMGRNNTSSTGSTNGGTGNENTDIESSMTGTNGGNKTVGKNGAQIQGKGEKFVANITPEIYFAPYDNMYIDPDPSLEAETVTVKFKPNAKLQQRYQKYGDNANNYSVAIRYHLYYKDANGNEASPIDHILKGKVGEPITLYPKIDGEKNKTTLYPVQIGNQVVTAYRRVNKDTDTKPYYTLIATVYGPDGGIVGMGAVDYKITETGTYIRSDSGQEKPTNVRSLNFDDMEETAKEFNYEFSGEILGAEYNQQTGMCEVRVNGGMTSNFDADAQVGSATIHTPRINANKCAELNSSPGESIVFTNVYGSSDANGTSIMVDNGAVNIGERSLDEMAEYYDGSTASKEQKPILYQVSAQSAETGWQYPGIYTTANGGYYKADGTPFTQNDYDYLIAHGVDLQNSKAIQEDGVFRVHKLNEDGSIGEYIGLNDEGATVELSTVNVIPGDLARQIINKNNSATSGISLRNIVGEVGENGRLHSILPTGGGSSSEGVTTVKGVSGKNEDNLHKNNESKLETVVNSVGNGVEKVVRGAGKVIEASAGIVPQVETNKKDEKNKANNNNNNKELQKKVEEIAKEAKSTKEAESTMQQNQTTSSSTSITPTTVNINRNGHEKTFDVGRIIYVAYDSRNRIRILTENGVVVNPTQEEWKNIMQVSQNENVPERIRKEIEVVNKRVYE